jgi:hypothetical protein
MISRKLMADHPLGNKKVLVQKETKFRCLLIKMGMEKTQKKKHC